MPGREGTFCDKVSEDFPLPAKAFASFRRFQLPLEIFRASSAKTGKNITELKQLILQKTAGKTDLNGEYITEKRHYIAICEALDSLERAIKAIDEYPMDLVSCDIKQSWEKLGEITGTTASEDVIEQIFAKFCVGK